MKTYVVCVIHRDNVWVFLRNFSAPREGPEDPNDPVVGPATYAMEGIRLLQGLNETLGLSIWAGGRAFQLGPFIQNIHLFDFGMLSANIGGYDIQPRTCLGMLLYGLALFL